MNHTTGSYGFDRALLEIYGELDRDRLMGLVVQYARDRLRAGGASIFLRDDITGRYVLRGTTGLLESDMPAGRIEYEPGEGLTGWIALHGRPLRIGNVRDEAELRGIADDLVWSKKYSEISTRPGQAYLGVPILAHDGKDVIGVLRVSGKRDGGRFDEQDEALLSHVAAMMSIAIANSQRYEREKRRARYFWLLLDIGSELDPRRPIGEMLRAVVRRVREGFRTEGCLIFLQAEDDARRLVLRAGDGVPAGLVGRLTCMAGEGLTGQIAATRTAIQAREPAELAPWQDDCLEKIAPHLPSGHYRSFVGVPLTLGGEVLGTMELINKIPSGPGHRDWFTDDDEWYLRLLATAIGGVLEGARYLKTLSDVSITTMRMQRIASFGSLAQRILHETANPLAVARLAATNLRRDLQEALDTLPTPVGRQQALLRRMEVIQTSLDEVGDKLLELVKCSQRVGFTRTVTDWNSIVREVLIWLAAERQRRQAQIHTCYADLPRILIEPNELFGVLATTVRLALEALGSGGGVIEVRTEPAPAGQGVQTTVYVPQAARKEHILAVLSEKTGTPERLSPFHFEWALARQTVEDQYDGSFTWAVEESGLRFTLVLPVEA